MNERIEKLLEQCQIETYGVNGELLEIGFDAEKFAELIVRKCADMLREREEHMHTRNNPISSIRSDECHIMADYIETHFGVEK